MLSGADSWGETLVRTLWSSDCIKKESGVRGVRRRPSKSMVLSQIQQSICAADDRIEVVLERKSGLAFSFRQEEIGFADSASLSR